MDARHIGIYRTYRRANPVGYQLFESYGLVFVARVAPGETTLLSFFPCNGRVHGTERYLWLHDNEFTPLRT